MTNGKYKPKPLPKRPNRQVQRNTKKINTLVRNIEYKFFEVVTNASPQNDEIIEDSLVKIAQGDTENTRDGRKIVVTGIHFRGFLVQDAAAANSATRIVLYVDKQPNGAVCATLDYFHGNNKQTQSFRNLDQVKRFRVLYDKTHVLNNNSATITSTRKAININLKVNIPINYSSTLGAITELNESNIGLMTSCANASVDLDGIWRIRYMDL